MTIANRTVIAPADVQADLKAAGAIMGAEPQEIDGNVLSFSGGEIAAWVEQSLALFAQAVEDAETDAQQAVAA